MSTVKQKAVVKKILENPGLAVSRAMEEVGYKPSVAKNPKDLTESKGWQELMDQYLPDPDLLKVHQEGLGATRVISAINTSKEANGATTDFIEVPDHQTRAKYLELGYKVKGKFAENVVQILNQGEMDIEFIGGEK